MQRFTQRARRVLSTAQTEAKRLNQSMICPEHMLLGLVLDDGGVAYHVLHDLGISGKQTKIIIDRLSAGRNEDIQDSKLRLSPTTELTLKHAVNEAQKLGHDYIGTEHILLSLVRDEKGIVIEVLKKLGISPEQVRRHTRRILKEIPPEAENISKEVNVRKSRKKQKKKTPLSDQLATDLTKLAESNKLDPVIGRHSEVERLIQILARRTKNNPALIGEPGVGKTAIVEGLAQRIVSGEVPELLFSKRVLQLDVGSIVAGTMYRGQFEERMKRIIDEIKQSGAILFIDEAHMLVGAGSAGSSVDAANILKPALSRGELQVIGATTLDEYRKHIEGDAALERRFQPVHVDEPTVDETIEILHGIKDRYEQHHRVNITDKAIDAAANLSVRYVADRFLPDKAIDLIDESASRVRMYKSPEALQLKEMVINLKSVRENHALAIEESRHDDANELLDREAELERQLEQLRAGWDRATGPQVKEEDIAEVVSMWTKIPVSQITEAETERLLHMEDALHKRIVGQNEAIESISRAIRRARAGLKDPHRPIGSFVFLGPTGVGKTELTKAMAEFLFGNEEALVQLDMSEFMERHTVSRLIGSPPGYVGYEDAGQLTEAIRRRPYSIVVFDEVEKAHPEAHNLLLQIMEEGHLSDSKGKKVDFRNALIIMTSNIGAELIRKQTDFGFQGSVEPTEKADQAYQDMQKNLTEALHEIFRPEFINRVDETIVFRSLTKQEINAIVDLELGKLRLRLNSRNLDLNISDSAKSFLANEGYDPEYGARPLRRVIQRHVEDPLSDMLLASPVQAGLVIIDLNTDKDEIKIDIDQKEISTVETQEPVDVVTS
ncbi:MAG TPA: NDP-hexose 4-ketoreductase [Chloroflexi bacterium]|nr:NDP-hexose 4-ketoreductase [Chloroflexota bacterium]|tara:strand:- start:1594 stop:4101 length:2508 start_codon:yes stop_codon:yes gene_type:complete